MVEDDPRIRALVAEVLQTTGYAVLQAGDGIEALRQLRRTRPDLIVLDLILPGMSGWQFLEQSRPERARSNIPVVILSAIAGHRDDPGALGVAAWLTKPLDIDRFLRAVQDLAGSPRQVARPPTARQPSAPAHILIVEDERPIRQVLVEHLADEGYVPDQAGSIDEAKALLVAHRWSASSFRRTCLSMRR